MNRRILRILVVLALIFQGLEGSAKTKEFEVYVKENMRRATEFMVEKVSYNGGYLWNYLPDFSRQWGEMEAYKTMIWLQHPGTISMGHLFLDAYRVTGDEYYYLAAEKAANAIIWGQSHEGGWNYLIDFAGDRSLKEWYNTIGKNGWRLEEFQHYYGNSTFDDNTTSDAARFLLRIYLEKNDPKYRPALEKAINFILESQYPSGGWPQRYPLKYDFNKSGHPDYTSFYTYNDGVIYENIHFLIQCYLTLGQERFLEPIQRAMNFYLISQDATGAWGHQYNMKLEPVRARTYEPDGLVTSISCLNALALIHFYEYTGDEKYIANIQRTIDWLENTKLPNELTENGKYTHPYYIEKSTGKPIYVHRKGSNVKYGYYYVDYNPENLIVHSKGKRNVPLETLIAEYNRVKAISKEQIAKNAILQPASFSGNETPQKTVDLNRDRFDDIPSLQQVYEILKGLETQCYWTAQHVMISHSYAGDGKNKDTTDQFAESFVGDETDTSPYRDTTDQKYISTSTYIENMHLLINYLKSLNY